MGPAALSADELHLRRPEKKSIEPRGIHGRCVKGIRGLHIPVPLRGCS